MVPLQRGVIDPLSSIYEQMMYGLQGSRAKDREQGALTNTMYNDYYYLNLDEEASTSYEQRLLLHVEQGGRRLSSTQRKDTFAPDP